MVDIKEYGICHFVQSDENQISFIELGDSSVINTLVKFGDGKNTIFSSKFEDGSHGIVISREDGKVKDPFGDTGEYNHTMDKTENVIIKFDNVKSVDALITSLVFVREKMKAD